jgi:HAD superfamily hydrolase (TIGR01509 family)
MSISWIFFDMGGVILDDSKTEELRQQALLELSQRYLPAVSMTDIYTAWMEASKLHGSLRMHALRILLKDSKKIAEAETEYAAICNNHNYHTLSTIRPEAKHVLATLNQRYKIGITANQSEKTIHLLETAGLLPYFSHQKMSAHIGLEKPDPQFFLTILRDTGAQATESVVIDDNWYRGLVPAKQLGMTTVLYKRDIIPYPETANPDWSITNLNDLLNIF